MEVIWKYLNGSGLRILLAHGEKAICLLTLAEQLQKEVICMFFNGFDLKIIFVYGIAPQQLKEVIYMCLSGYGLRVRLVHGIRVHV